MSDQIKDWKDSFRFVLSGARKPISAPRSAIRRVLPVAYAPERALHSRQNPFPPPTLLHTRQSAHFNWEGLDITGNIRNPYVFKHSRLFFFFWGEVELHYCDKKNHFFKAWSTNLCFQSHWLFIIWKARRASWGRCYGNRMRSVSPSEISQKMY